VKVGQDLIHVPQGYSCCIQAGTGGAPVVSLLDHRDSAGSSVQTGHLPVEKVREQCCIWASKTYQKQHAVAWAEPSEPQWIVCFGVSHCVLSNNWLQRFLPPLSEVFFYF